MPPILSLVSAVLYAHSGQGPPLPWMTFNGAYIKRAPQGQLLHNPAFIYVFYPES